MKRLFAALKIQPDAEFLVKYGELKQELHHEPIKWVEDHNIHVTLKFFGETEERRIPEISSVLQNRASFTPSFCLKLDGLGIFGSAYAPRVIWVGIEPFADLSSLMKNIHGDLKSIGFEPDRQNLVPHLTLGRIKYIRDKVIFNRTMARFKTISSSPLTIRNMVLYESILRREGPEYLVLEKYSFR
jgi:RNA 2',3'-cyclic 3'-phosphodiesterase